MKKPISSHSFIFNRSDNGGEQLILTTEFWWNGDLSPAGIFTTQELTLNSYCNSATFALSGATITSDDLEGLAKQLRESEEKAANLVEQVIP